MDKEQQNKVVIENFNEPLAIIGMNCRFPGINEDIEDTEAFYDMLVKGQTPIKDVPASRWDSEQYYDANRSKADKVVTRKGGFLTDPYLFDADFFKILSAEVKQMDPQHRLFLEAAIHALNHANIAPSSLKGSTTSVYCGISTHEYNQLNIKNNIEFNKYTQIGVANSAAVGRLCHYLDLKGPSLAVDTACSSSLSALYLAASALINRQCNLAIAGGVHLNLCPDNFIAVSKAKLLSATGKCSSFDSKADGYVRSEGCAVVVVKRLDDALRDNDKIYGVIKSIAMNHDGAGVSLAAPNENAQIAMHQQLLAQAQVNPKDIDYIETHGTGTVAGDTVEFRAIEQIHEGQHTKDKPLYIGALKSILGHTLSSSGLASVIKVLNAFSNEIIPPNLNYSSPNPSINPDCIPAVIPTQAVPFLKKTDKKRVAQVLNFGFSGINVSVLLEEPPPNKLTPALPVANQCFTLSANSEHSLKQMLNKHIAFLKQTTASLNDICSTLIQCRDHYKFRCAILVNDKETLITQLESADYTIQKVTVKKEEKLVESPQQIYDYYLAGHTIKLNLNRVQFNKINLPLYCFDRKPYYHEPRLHHLAQGKSTSVMNDTHEPIAIIGMSCRFPKAANIDEFFTLLKQGGSGMDDIPLDRWDNAKYYDEDVNALGRLYIKQLGLIDNVKNFDANFFNISPREAKFMSPQLRIFMETTYHALENANQPLDAIKNTKTGVFVGIGTNEYPRVLEELGMGLEDLNIYFATGNVLNALAGRIAYAFDFHGPIQVIDTACSSSMTAIHNAFLSLQSGDCTMAIAGGVNILLTPHSNITLSKAKMLSPDSRCKTFSEDADGYARSEGCGVVVLKPLSAALKDNDNILAVIKGTAINSSGKSTAFTVPNGRAQEAVIRNALAKAKLSPSDIDHIEAHGTGTPLADPIEMNTLTRIFSDSHHPEKPLYVSSVKTNIGHSESASGVAGIIKAVLSLQHHVLFKHINFKKLHPDIKLNHINIPLETIPWQKEQGLRHVGVSSFGFSGANAHVILQEALPKTAEKTPLPPQEFLLVLSAKSQRALELLLNSYQNFLAVTQEDFADICYTASTCRTHFLFRTTIKAKSAQEAAQLIKENNYTIYAIKKEKKSTRTQHIYQVTENSSAIEQLQAAYQKGFMINWHDYYHAFNHTFKKVNLPLYEFDREEYWFEEKGKLKDAPILKDWCFQLQWQPQTLNANNKLFHSKNWLLIGSKKLASDFSAQGLHIILEEDFDSWEKLNGIIFAMDLEAVSSTDIESNITFQKTAIKKLLTLIKQAQANSAQLKLIVLTLNGIAELAADTLNLNHASLIGFCKTLGLELPQYQMTLIDTDNIASCPSQLLDEINYNHSQNYEHIVAYRDGQRLVARLKKMPLADAKPNLAVNGRYLITGGCGGLGLVTAQALLSAGAQELILVSRNSSTPTTEAAINNIKSLYPGRLIRAVSLDITDKETLKGFLTELNEDGRLKGIIHAAGAAVKASVLEHTEQDIDYLFAAKVKGGWYLHELSQHCNLDFFIVYSSIASVFGSNKESVYSGTNSFLDALIEERRRLGLAGSAIQWGPWGEAGMAVKRAQNQRLKNALISNEQGHAFIKRVIATLPSHITIIAPDYLSFMLDYVSKPWPGFYQGLADELHSLEQPAELKTLTNQDLSPWVQAYLEQDEVSRLKTCKKLVNDICNEIMELSSTDSLEEDEGFFDLGFDSLMMAELAMALKKTIGPSIQIVPSIAFDYPSINKLAHYLNTELNTQLATISALPSTEKQDDDSIAIIGMSCSLPNAPDIAAFELLLEQGLSGMKEIPIERWDNRKYYDANMDAPRKSYVDKMGLIDHVKLFDADFFGISPREAKLMDPQQRLFLECSYKALEHANYTLSSLRGSLTGVFAGVGPNEYYATLEKSGFSNEELSTYSITGNVLNLIPGRVAYTFDFKGPSISIDTSCSSSLVAIHYACNSLKNREIDYALAGGVNILLMPESNITLCKAKALAPDGQCKTFDERADGYARGEGCGVIFLKRLSDALRDKDTILAVIKGSAVNNDGKAAGLTVPNGKSQEEVMLKALNQTGLTSHDISYIEAHGTGTPLGDPIEVYAINSVYDQQRDNSNPLYLGSVKTNIGHLEAASGVASVIRTVISLQKKKIYKHLNFKKLNPNIELNTIQIATQNTEWKTAGKLRYAGVSAFGFSGTNAHLILQESPIADEAPTQRSSQQYALVLSAKSKISLERLIERYQHFLAHTHDDFGDICFTAATCREHYSYRLVLIAETAKEASTMLNQRQFILSYGNKSSYLDLQDDLMQSLVTQYLEEQNADWLAYYEALSPDWKKVKLPYYTFDRSEFWSDKKSDNLALINQIHPLLGQMLPMPGNEYLFNQKLELENLSYIEQYRVFDKVIFPAAAYIEAGLSASKIVLKQKAFCLENFSIQRQLYPSPAQEFQVHVKPQNQDQYQLKIFAKQTDNWQQFAEMNFYSIAPANPEHVDLQALKTRGDQRLNKIQIYENFQTRKIQFGEELQVLQEAFVSSDALLAHVVLNKSNFNLSYYYHSASLDGIMQSLLLLCPNNFKNLTYVPSTFKKMVTFHEAPRHLWAHVSKRHTNENELCADVKLYDQSGLLIAYIEELKLQAVQRHHFVAYEAVLNNLYYTDWKKLELNQLADSPVPYLFVISKNPNKAEKLLGRLDYQLVTDLTELEHIAHKNIVFLYEENEFLELVHCCQTLFITHPKSFILVTENAYAAATNNKVNPYHTMAASFWRSFRNELALNKNFAVDLDSHHPLTTLLPYLFSDNGGDNQFLVRDNIYTPRLQRQEISLATEEKTLFDKNSSYLITGGTGALAKLLIDYLIKRGVKHLILTSRSACPADIKALIEHARQHEVDIKHYEADAGDYQQMAQLIQTINHSDQPLKGIFHLAGIIRDGLIVNLSDNDIQAVLNAKANSALILHQLTENIALDMFVLFSSSASLLGAKGQSNYVAANGFLDGLAYLRHQQGLPALVINWGPFHALGMTSKITQALQHYGFIPLNKDSIDLLDVLLPSQLIQISPCPINWELFFKHSPKYIELSSFYSHDALSAQSYFLNALRKQTKAECNNILTRVLYEITADVLGLNDTEQLTSKDGLLSMGVDSLMSIEIRNRIHDRLQYPSLSLPIEYFINDPSIEKIAAKITHELHELFKEEKANRPSQNLVKKTVLCDFQYTFWVLNRFNFSYNTAMQLHLHGELNKNYFIQAFEFVINQHDALWLNFSEKAPIQSVRKKGQFKLIYNDLSRHHDVTVLNKEFYQNTMRCIPLNEQPLIRVYLYKINANLHELHLVFPHIIVDDASCDLVFKHFRESYEALRLGKKLSPIIEKKSFLNYVKYNNWQYQRNLTDKIDFWRAYNKDCTPLYFGPGCHLPDAAVYQAKHLFHYPICADITTFIEWHKEHNINISSGLIAACQLAFSKMSRQGQIPIILIHTGREGSHFKSVVGLFSEYKRINLDLDDNYEFIDCVKSVEEQLLKTAPYQKCSYFIKNIGLTKSPFSKLNKALSLFNKRRLTCAFKESNIHPQLINFYLEYVNQVKALRISSKIKHKLNQLFNWKIPLQKPDGLKVLINMTSSFFMKEAESTRFADLEYSFPSYFGGLDRPIGNQTLWIYFSKDANGDYQLSINGPLTNVCREQIALNFNNVISQFVKNHVNNR